MNANGNGTHLRPKARAAHPPSDYAKFLIRFLRNPKRVGALAPSSAALSREMVCHVDWSKVRTVLEIGPGTGACTPSILAHMEPGTRFIAIEIDPVMAKSWRRKHPELTVVEGDAADARALLSGHGIDSVDMVVSGLPWAAFSSDLQNRMMGGIFDVLKPGGHFVTFAYVQGTIMPAGLKFGKMLGRKFRCVKKSRTVWANFPPAFAYRCRR